MKTPRSGIRDLSSLRQGGAEREIDPEIQAFIDEETQAEGSDAHLDEVIATYGIKPKTDHDHHGLPQNETSKAYWSQLDVAVDETCMQVDGERHLNELHKIGKGYGDLWNEPWDKFMEENPLIPDMSAADKGALRAAGYSQLEALRAEFDLTDNETYAYKERSELTNLEQVFGVEAHISDNPVSPVDQTHLGNEAENENEMTAVETAPVEAPADAAPSDSNAEGNAD